MFISSPARTANGNPRLVSRTAIASRCSTMVTSEDEKVLYVQCRDSLTSPDAKELLYVYDITHIKQPRLAYTLLLPGMKKGG